MLWRTGRIQDVGGGRNGIADGTFQADALALRCADYHDTLMDAVSAMGQAFGFETFFFLQPTVYTTTPLVAIEKKYIEKERQQLYLDTLAILATRPRPNRFDISHLFEGKSGRLFLDSGHVWESGNVKVAEAMHAIITSHHVGSAAASTIVSRN